MNAAPPAGSPAPHLSHAVRISNPMGLALSLLVTDCY
jgi:hypothetical protein